MQPAQTTTRPKSRFFRRDPDGAYLLNDRTGVIRRRYLSKDRSLTGRQRRIVRKAARAAQRVKLYEMGSASQEWIAARSPKEALREFPSSDFDITPRELTHAEMDRCLFRDDDGSTRTFRQQLQRLKESGAPFPCYFASGNC